MKRYNYLAAAGVGLAIACASAQAQMKDPIPDSLSLGGVTLYGTVDVGYAYQSKGVPLSSSLPGGLEYQAFTTTRNYAGSVSTVAESGLEQSKIGIRVGEPITGDFTLVARAETGFNPLSGELTDACKSLAVNAGVVQGQQTANADSSRCGQAFNSMLFGGISNPTYGTLTIGRHNSLELDALASYDPQTLSYAFSFLGYSGFDGGAGSTQAARWDNSAKYALTYGPVHAAAMYSSGGADTGMLGRSLAGQVGFTYGGLSVDGVYEYERGAVNLRSSYDDGTANPLPTPGLAAYISNNTSFNFMGKYTFEFGDSKVKDKLTLYAGYSHIQKAHGDYSGGDAENGYPIDVGIDINKPTEYSLEWAGARYAMASGWNFTGAVYHSNVNSWTIGVGPTGTNGIGCDGAGLLCAGNFYEASAVADYIINKHYDAYAGVNWSEVQAGLASGYVGTPGAGTNGTIGGSENSTTVMVGFRVRF
jgi:predicted porin